MDETETLSSSRRLELLEEASLGTYESAVRHGVAEAATASCDSLYVDASPREGCREPNLLANNLTVSSFPFFYSSLNGSVSNRRTPPSLPQPKTKESLAMPKEYENDVSIVIFV